MFDTGAFETRVIQDRHINDSRKEPSMHRDPPRQYKAPSVTRVCDPLSHLFTPTPCISPFICFLQELGHPMVKILRPKLPKLVTDSSTLIYPQSQEECTLFMAGERPYAITKLTNNLTFCSPPPALIEVVFGDVFYSSYISIIRGWHWCLFRLLHPLQTPT